MVNGSGGMVRGGAGGRLFQCTLATENRFNSIGVLSFFSLVAALLISVVVVTREEELHGMYFEHRACHDL